MQKNSTQIWGTKNWTVTDVKKIVPLSQARGKIVAGVRGTLNKEGKRLYMARFRSTMLAHHIFASVDKDGQDALRVNKEKYEWFANVSGV